MFDKDEWIKLLKYTGYGAAVGAGLCVLLFVYEFVAEMWNCMCDCFGGCSEMPEVDSGFTFLFVFLISLAIGLMVGLFSAFSDRNYRLAADERRRKENESEEAKRQRIKWASEVKQKSLEVANVCDKNYKSMKPMITAKYRADGQMTTISDELANISELSGKINAMAQDVKMKGGISE